MCLRLFRLLVEENLRPMIIKDFRPGVDIHVDRYGSCLVVYQKPLKGPSPELCKIITEDSRRLTSSRQ